MEEKVEGLNSREQLTMLVDGLIATVIQVDEYYSPEELKRRFEQLQLLKGQIKDFGYDRAREEIRNRVREDVNQIRERVSHNRSRMEGLIPQRRPNQIKDEIGNWMGGRFERDLIDDIRRNGRLQNAVGVISAWQAEDLEKESQITNFSPSEN